MTGRITFIRHGLAECAENHVVGGHLGCTGLTEAGRAQARLLRDRVARTGELADTEVVLTSKMARAIETASIVLPAIGPQVPGPIKRCDLCEYHPGSLDGMPEAALLAFRRDNPSPLAASAGGESPIMFGRRATRAILAITAEYEGKSIVAVTHGGIIIWSFAALGGLRPPFPFDARPDHTSVTEWLAPTPHSGGGRWRLARYNDTAHLDVGPKLGSDVRDELSRGAARAAPI